MKLWGRLLGVVLEHRQAADEACAVTNEKIVGALAEDFETVSQRLELGPAIIVRHHGGDRYRPEQ